MKLLKKMRYIFSMLLIVSLLFSITPVGHGFAELSMGVRQHLEMNKLLIFEIKKPQWKIGYNYGVDCESHERQNGKALTEAISTSLRAWLKPLRELQPKHPIVDQFVYELQADYDPDRRHDPVLLADRAAVDLQVSFGCKPGRISHASIGGKYPPAVRLSATTYMLEHEMTVKIGTAPATSLVLTHEIGHAFGLADTYDRPGYMRSRGGFPWTAGKQPWSFMAPGSDLNGIMTPHGIGEDDKRGIVWLYKFVYEGIAGDDCFFDDYIFVEEPRGCRPKHPLIFEIKHNHPALGLELLNEDPSIDDINAQDGDGMTALHYAVMHESAELVKALLEHKDINPSLQNKQGMMPYDLALVSGFSEILKMLPKPPRRKEDVNDDGIVNILDLVAVAAKLGQKNAGSADINADGKADILDLVKVAGAF